MPPEALSVHALSDALACARRFHLTQVECLPEWDATRWRSSIHEIVAQLVRAVERLGRELPVGAAAEEGEARLIERARLALRRVCDAQPVLGQGRRPSIEALISLVEREQLPPGFTQPQLVEEVDASMYSRASVKLLRGAVGVLTNAHARWVRSGTVALLDPADLLPVTIGLDVRVKPDPHLLYQRRDQRVVAVLWRTGAVHEEHRHHAVLVEEALRAAFPLAPGVACVNAYTFDGHEELVREEDRDAAAVHWAAASLVANATYAGELPTPLPLGSKPCKGCRMAPACGR